MFLYSEQPTTESVQEVQEPMQSLSAPVPQFVHSEQAGVPTQTKSSMVENSGKFFQRPEKMEIIPKRIESCYDITKVRDGLNNLQAGVSYNHRKEN